MDNVPVPIMLRQTERLRQLLKNLPRRVEQLKKQYPEADIEVWAFDEHRLWQLSDEPLVNRKFETLEELEEPLAIRCVTLSAMPEVIRQHILFHWWKNV
ncbi:MAG: hypothetical protein OHK0047_24820 [Leptolyngbyaceae cyanobacterium]